MEETNGKQRPKQTGRALEIDVIKKISHQLDREGLTVDAMGRILAFVQDAVREKKLDQVANMSRDGQMAVHGTTQEKGLF